MIKLILFTILIVFSSNTTSNSQKINSIGFAEIDQYLDDKIGEGEPGLAVGVVQNGKTIYTRYLGYASLQHRVTVSDSTRFNIASVAKQFTALCVLQLALDNKLNLEDDIRKYLPEFYPQLQKEIKIRHLLNHTSGIRDFYDLLSIKSDPWWRKEGFDNDDALEILEKQQSLNFDPGSQYLYSNSNYTILTKLVSQVSGESFHGYSEKILRKMGMDHTFFLKNYMPVIPNQALPYSDWGNGIWQQYPMMTNLYGDGFLFTTLSDQINFEIAIQKADNYQDSLLILSQKPIKNSDIKSYGFGLELGDRMDRKAVHHSGATGSYHAQTVRYPDAKLSIVVMSNHGNIWSGYIADKIASVLLPETNSIPSNLVHFDPQEYLNIKVLSDINGEYQSNSGYVIKIYEESGDLYWKSYNNNASLLQRDTGSIFLFKGDNESRVAFNHGEFTLYSKENDPRKYRKLPPFSPNIDYLKELAGRYNSQELDIAYDIKIGPKKNLVVSNSKWNKDKVLSIVQKDQLYLSNYIIRIKRKEAGEVEGFLLTVNRVKDVFFEKE
jgi:CubicO group peptidase (beta-lactamase class C family)